MKEHGCSTAAGAIKILGQLWKEMSEAQKKPYTNLRDKDLLRFQRQAKELAEKGYFTEENGERSNKRQPGCKVQPKSQAAGTKLGKRKQEERATISIVIDDDEEQEPQKLDHADAVMALVE